MPPHASDLPPTHGDPLGVHRVLQPPGTLPSRATRLDPSPELWDSEVRLSVTDLVVRAAELEQLVRQGEGDPVRARAGLLEAVAERGGLPSDLNGTVLFATVERLGTAAGPPGLSEGSRVAVAPPVPAVPMWLTDLSAWDGGRHLPARGHAVAGPSTPLLPIPGALDVRCAAEIVLAAHVPAAVGACARARSRSVVTGPTTVAGALATVVAGRRGSTVAAVVTGLEEARLARALGAEPVIVAPGEPAEGARAVLEAIGGRADLVALGADQPLQAALTAAVTDDRARVLALVPGIDADELVREAAATGRSIDVRVPGGPWPEAAEQAFTMLDTVPMLAEVTAWRAGAGPAPAVRHAVTRPETAREDR